MIRLVVGLGNPGVEYEKTRHNAGFLFVDALQAKYGGNWLFEDKFKGFVCRISLGTCAVLLLKPGLFMNRSGQSVAKLLGFYKIFPEELLVVHDELDFCSGVVKLKTGGGHAGHNGLRDIITCLGRRDFHRLRLGIGRPSLGKSVAGYVLSVPPTEDRVAINNAIDSVLVHVDQLVAGDIEIVRNKINSL